MMRSAVRRWLGLDVDDDTKWAELQEQRSQRHEEAQARRFEQIMQFASGVANSLARGTLEARGPHVDVLLMGEHHRTELISGLAFDDPSKPETLIEPPRPHRSIVEPTWLGASCELNAGPPRMVVLSCDRPLVSLQLIVFCDLSRVRVQHVFRGTDLVGTFGGDMHAAPVARIDRLEPGVLVRVQLELRS